MFVRRPREHGAAQTTDLRAEQDWDVVVESLVELADVLGCPPS
jgi:2-haloacid dehalogenase